MEGEYPPGTQPTVKTYEITFNDRDATIVFRRIDPGDGASQAVSSLSGREDHSHM